MLEQRNAKARVRIFNTPNDYSGVRGGQAVVYLATIPDEQLLQEALRDGEEAATELVRRYNSRAVRWVCGAIGDVHLAKDIVQNHWIELLKSARRDLPINFETFFWSLLRRRVIDAWRKQQRSREDLYLDAPLSSDDVEGATKGSQIADDLPDPVDTMIAVEDKKEFWQAMELLPARYREAVRARGVKGLSWTESARELISQGLMDGQGNVEKQMQNHFYRAIDALEKLIRDLSAQGGAGNG